MFQADVKYGGFNSCWCQGMSRGGTWRFRVDAPWSMPQLPHESTGPAGQQASRPAACANWPSSAVPGATPRGGSSESNNAVEGRLFDHGSAWRRCQARHRAHPVPIPCPSYPYAYPSTTVFKSAPACPRPPRPPRPPHPPRGLLATSNSWVHSGLGLIVRERLPQFGFIRCKRASTSSIRDVEHRYGPAWEISRRVGRPE
jgi:hypothetical protein